MEQISKEYLIRYYSDLLMHHKDNPGAVQWSLQGQAIRHKALLDLSGKINETTVLDYGCGKGDLLSLIKTQGNRVRYTGVDITHAMLVVAREKHPEARFIVHDIEDGPLDDSFDFTFICGVFNFNISGVEEGMKNSTRLLFNHTSRRLILNALTSEHSKSYDLHYVDPEDLLRFAKTHITADAHIRLDIIPGDIFLVLNK